MASSRPGDSGMLAAASSSVQFIQLLSPGNRFIQLYREGDADAVAFPLHVATDVDFRLLCCVPTEATAFATTAANDLIGAVCRLLCGDHVHVERIANRTLHNC